LDDLLVAEKVALGLLEDIHREEVPEVETDFEKLIL